MDCVQLSEDVLSQFVNRARRLYSLPAVALRLLELTANSSVDVQELAACVEQDPALTTKILRVVNSSLFGLHQRVSTVKQSIALLGTQPLKMLVLGFSLPGNLASSSGSQVLLRYWQQSLLTALSAREMAESWFQRGSDEAFAAGLLQDLGQLLLVQDLGETYEQFLIGVWQQGGDILAEERQVLGFDHRTLTAKLLESWNLPAPFVASIYHSPDASAAGEDTLAHILHLAERVAVFLVDRDPSRLKTILEIGESGGAITMSKLELLITVLDKKTPQLAKLLSIELPDEMVYSDVLLQAYKRLSDAMDDSDGDWLQPIDDTLLHDWDQVANASRNDEYAVGIKSPRAQGPAGKVAFRTQTSTCAAPRRTRTEYIDRIAGEVARCRQARSAVSLILIELDDVARRTVAVRDVESESVQRLDATIHDIVDGEATAARIGDARFALLVPCERRLAVDLGWRITDNVRGWSLVEGFSSRRALSVSVGVATLSMPPRNFPAEELLTAAERCLSGVQLSGGDSLKSIDIY